MSKSVTAALVSALVLPGAGHFYLKKPVKGTLLMGITFICLYYLFSTVFTISQNLSARIQSGEIPFEVGKMTELISQELSGGDDQVIVISTFLLVFSWAVATFDSYRVGKVIDKNEAAEIR